MRTRRPISINNSLCHGICNYNCQLCGVNKKSYHGPKQFQSREVTEKLIARIQEAGQQGIRLRIVANSGDGEPTLHPEFRARMHMFGDMLRTWNAPVPAPEISIVTNGSRLMEPDVLEALSENPVTVNMSFPTSDPETYGQLMTGDPAQGKAMLEKVMPGMEQLMRLRATGRLSRLHFHMSPPDRTLIRRDFAGTLDFLTRMAQKVGLAEISLVMFPGTSNRSGLIKNRIKTADSYADLFRQYDGKLLHGVRVRMTTVIKRFFVSIWDVIDLIRAFDHPCIWNGNFFITASGDSICCNDQAVRNPMGNIQTDSLEALMMLKERRLPGPLCAGCDSAPRKMRGSVFANVYGLVARTRFALALVIAAFRTEASAPVEVPVEAN